MFIKRIILLSIIISALGQSNAQDGYIIGKESLNKIIDSLTLKNGSGDDVDFSRILVDKQPLAVLFAFKGCFGCKLSLEEVLVPNYKALKDKFGLNFIIISREGPDAMKEASEYYKSYPFPYYFDDLQALYRLIPVVPLADGRRLKAYPSLVIFDNSCNYVSVDPFSLESISEATQWLYDLE